MIQASPPTTLAERIAAVRAAITAAETAASRPIGSVQLLAVSKTRPAQDLAEAYALGLSRFGESYVQEAMVKIQALTHLPLEWHFIGPIQSNKTRDIAEHFAWVHSVDRLKIAQRLSDQRPDNLPPLKVCLQVNISGEVSKSGIRPDEAEQLAREVARLPRLQLKGLMAIPAPATEPALQHRPFRELRELRDRIEQATGLTLPELSMGMSDDLAAAIVEGATLVRIGSAIFGARATT